MAPVLLLILLGVSDSCGHEISSQQMEGVVTSLQKHLHSCSVVVFYNNTSGLMENMQLLKLIKGTGVPTAASGNFKQILNVRMSLHVVLSPKDLPKRDLASLDDCRSGPTWLLFLKFQSLENFFEDIFVPVDCEVIVFQKDNSLVEVYHLQERLHISSVGSWSISEGLVWNVGDFHERRSDLKDTVIRAASIDEPPITVLENENGTLHGVSGFFGEVWSTLEQRMNFTTVFSTPADGAWGAKRNNGSWTGMIAMILKGEVDLAVSEFSITPTRTVVIDFTLPLIHTRFCVLIRQPGSTTSRWANFLEPFSPILWFLIFLIILTIGVLLATIQRYDDSNISSFNLQDAVFYMFGIFCQQGQEDTPPSLSGRLLCLAAYMTITILPAAYSAALVSFLAVQRTSLPFSNFRGLLQQRSYSLAVLANSGQLNYFDHAVDPLMKQLYSQLIAPQKDDLPPSIYEGLMRICTKQNYAFMTSLEIALSYTKVIPCAVVPVVEASIPDNLAIAVAKQSPYRSLINYNLQELRGSGVLERLRVKTWPNKMKQVEPTWTGVGLETMTPVLCIVVAGAVAAFICLLVEKLLWLRSKHKRGC